MSRPQRQFKCKAVSCRRPKSFDFKNHSTLKRIHVCIYIDEHWVIYRITESLHDTPETYNVTPYVNNIGIKILNNRSSE